MDATKPNFDKMIKGSDVQMLRELMGMGGIDIYWLTGIGTVDSTWKLTGTDSDRPVPDPTLSILVRFLKKYPEMTYLPKFPDLRETFECINDVDPELLLHKKKQVLTLARFAPLFGKSEWNAKRWENGISEPTSVARRLFYVIVKMIKEEGQVGLIKYLEVVEEEANARNLDGLQGVFLKGSWKKKMTQKHVNAKFGHPKREVRNKKNLKPIVLTKEDKKTPPDFNALMKGFDIQALREILGIGVIDIYWFVGIGTIDSIWRLTDEGSLRPLPDPTLSILVRCLNKYPHLNYMPEFPEYDEVFEAVNKTNPKLMASKKSKGVPAVRRFAPLFGKSDWNSQQWRDELSEPSSVVKRLFYLVLKCIHKKGANGLKEYIDVVNEEAISRDLGGLERVLDKGAWKKKETQIHINKKYGIAKKDQKRLDKKKKESIKIK